jgi:hypothetical protein
MLVVGAPLYLLESVATCWKCGALQPVIAFGAERILEDSGGDDAGLWQSTDFTLLNYIEDMPDAVYRFVCAFHPGYRKVFSMTADMEYYANTCGCGAFFGDWFLVCEAGGAFFPEMAADARRITISTIPLGGELAFTCSWSQGARNAIRDFAIRV